MLLAQEFDRDPLLLLKFRGFERAEILQGLGVTAKQENGNSDEQFLVRGSVVDVRSFWAGSGLVSSPSGDGDSSTHGPHAYLRQVGHFPMWRGDKPLTAILEPLYEKAVSRVMSVPDRDSTII